MALNVQQKVSRGFPTFGVRTSPRTRESTGTLGNSSAGAREHRSQKKICFDRESNTGPSDLQSDALPTELSKHLTIVMTFTFLNLF